MSLDSLDSELGYFAAVNYKNTWKNRTDGVSKTYGGENGDEVDDDFKFEETSNNIDISGLLSLGLETESSSFKSNTIASRVTQEKVKTTAGFDGDAQEESIRWLIEWEEREFISQQFAGQHYFGANEDLTMDWQATASRASRYAPDRREVRFDLSGSDGVYNLEVPNLTRRFDDLDDTNLDGSLDFDYFFGTTGRLETELSFGIQAISRERDSKSATYGYRGGQFAIDDNSQNIKVSDILNLDTITGDTDTGYTFQDKTQLSDSYKAQMSLNSAYLSVDTLWESSIQAVIGVRYEDYEQTTDTFSLEGEQNAVQSTLSQGIALPTDQPKLVCE